MRLHGILDGRLYATDYRTVLFETAETEFKPVGCLPLPTSGLTSLRYRFLTTRGWKSILERIVGSFPSVTLHRLTSDDLLATAGPWLFTSNDGGGSWQLRRELPPSSGPMGVLPTAVSYHDGTVRLGEYPLASQTEPRILRSDDHGRTWTTERVLSGVRHVHAIQVDPYTGDHWVTTGDTDEECMIARIRDGELEVVGTGSQHWRAVELAFTPSAILWGVDCTYIEKNPILKLERGELDCETPTPIPVTAMSDSVYYSETIPVGDDLWVVFSTAAETKPDSTAPTAGTSGSGTVSVVAASSASEYTHWFDIAKYPRQSRPVDRLNPGGWFPAAAAYAFLVADAERGLFINPLNTVQASGTIQHLRPSVFEQLHP